MVGEYSVDSELVSNRVSTLYYNANLRLTPYLN